jgi:hypothetical protein
MPIATTQKEIEIVVAGINNQATFYEYVVYNHTSGVDVIEPQRTICTRILLPTKVSVSMTGQKNIRNGYI